MIAPTAHPKEDNKSRKIHAILRVLISAFLVLLLFTTFDLREVSDAFAVLDPTMYSIGLVAFLLSNSLLWGLRWKRILEAAGVQIELRLLVKYNFVGSFFSLFLPTAIGGDVARLFDISERTEKFADALSSVLLDRVIGLVSLVFLALFALAAGNQFVGGNTVYLSTISLLVFLALTWALFFSSVISGWVIRLFHLPLLKRALGGVQNLYLSLDLIRRSPSNLVSALGVSVVAQILEVLSVIWIALSINIEVQPVYYFIFIPIIWILTLMPVSLGGLGVREGAFVLLFSNVGVSPAEAVALSVLVYSCRILMGLIGGLIVIRQTNAYYLKLAAIFHRKAEGNHDR